MSMGAQALFLPGETVVIDGVKCGIIDDAISTSTPPEGTVPLSSAHDPWRIFCSLEHLKQMRIQFSGLTLYGFWQVLAASRIWRPETPIMAYQDAMDQGQYVYSDRANIVTGEVIKGQLIPGPMVDFSDIETEWIDLAEIVPRLTLPAQPAETPLERVSRTQAHSRKKWFRTGAAAAAAVFGFLVGGQIAQLIDAGQKERLAGLQAELAALEEQSKGAADGRMRELPDQREKLNALLAVTLRDPSVKIERGLLNNPLKLLLNRKAYELYFAGEFDLPVFLQRGGVEVTLQ